MAWTQISGVGVGSLITAANAAWLNQARNNANNITNSHCPANNNPYCNANHNNCSNHGVCGQTCSTHYSAFRKCGANAMNDALYIKLKFYKVLKGSPYER